MNSWDYTQQDQDDRWIRQNLEDEEQQQLDEQKKILAQAWQQLVRREPSGS